MEAVNLPIAVIDSGVGGISVLKELVKIMPNERYLYFGDSVNAPYGQKSKEEVLQITRKNLEMLKAIGIKALVIACNTATSAAAKVLREENPDLIIIGIEPAIKPASLVCSSPTVLIMATALTLREEKFCSLVNRFSDSADFLPLTCNGLVELIEKGDVNSEEIGDYLTRLFKPYKNKNIDAIVLGCTHYPHIKSRIAEHFKAGMPILDGSEGTAKHTMRRLEEKNLLNRSLSASPKIQIMNSSPDERLIKISKNFLYA